MGYLGKKLLKKYVVKEKDGAEVAGRYAAVMGSVETDVIEEISVNTMEELSELISDFVTRVCRGINGVFVYKFSENPTEGVMLIRMEDMRQTLNIDISVLLGLIFLVQLKEVT